MVVVSGESGAGKTSFVEAFVDRWVTDERVLWGACDPLPTPRPLGPIHDVAHRLARGIKAGTVTVNTYGEGDISTPFGGYKQSGFGGRDKGIEAFDQYTELKTIWFALGT